MASLLQLRLFQSLVHQRVIIPLESELLAQIRAHSDIKYRLRRRQRPRSGDMAQMIDDLGRHGAIPRVADERRVGIFRLFTDD